MVWNAFANRFKQPRPGKERRRRDRTAVRDRGAFAPSLGGEWLENRALLAAFTYDSVAESLTIDLDNTNEAITLTSTSASINATLTAAGIPVNAWISATATKLVSSVPTDTSQFSAGVRAAAG